MSCLPRVFDVARFGLGKFSVPRPQADLMMRPAALQKMAPVDRGSFMTMPEPKWVI